MPTRPVHTKLAALERERIFDGAVERVAVRSDDALVTVNWIQPGDKAPPPHDHPFDQLSFILTGTLEFFVGDERFVVGPGECLAIPAGAPHTAQPHGDEVILNVDVFAPIRDDYLHLVEHSAEYFAR